jgi:hypothetical protein
MCVTNAKTLYNINITNNNSQGDNMKTYEYALIWHSQYGKEEVDSCDDRLEAKRLQIEYRMAFGEGHIEIKKRRT